MLLFINNITAPNNIAQLISLREQFCEVRKEILNSSERIFARTLSINLTSNNYKRVVSCVNEVNQIPILMPIISPKELSYLLSDKVFISASAAKDYYKIFLERQIDCSSFRNCQIVSIQGTKITSSTKTPVEKLKEQYRDFNIKFDKKPIKPAYVTLINKQIGFFVPSICFAYCNPASIIWEQNGFQYQIDMQARGTNEDLKWISFLANSAIENKLK